MILFNFKTISQSTLTLIFSHTVYFNSIFYYNGNISYAHGQEIAMYS